MGSREGFKEEEIPEYLGRKSEAIVLMVVGVVIAFGGAALEAIALGPSGLGLVFLTFVGGLIIAAYGQHYWSKVTHIMWTRQALREYGISPSQPQGAFSAPKLLLFYPQYKCPHCNNALPANALLTPGIYKHDFCKNEVTISPKTVEDARRVANERLREEEIRASKERSERKVDTKSPEEELQELSQQEGEIRESLTALDGLSKSAISEETLKRRRGVLEEKLLDIALERNRIQNRIAENKS